MSSRDESLEDGKCQEPGDEGECVLVRDSNNPAISCFKNCAHIATRATLIRMYKEVITVERRFSLESLTEFLEPPPDFRSS